MFNITLISTRHANLGKCNSHELYNIIEQINPQVIFEEKPPSYYDKYYITRVRSGLESDAINAYSQNYDFEHILVDSEDLPSDKFWRDYQYMFEKVEKLTDINGFNIRNLIDSHQEYLAKYGFNYLNSDECIRINKETVNAIEGGLKKLNKEKLFQTFRTWKDIQEKRENHMLQNIYNFSETHSYERAIFTIGSAHRGTLIEKIKGFQKEAKVKLDWIY